MYDHTKGKLDQNDQPSEGKSTREKIASQLKIGSATVQRATILTQAIDTIVTNTGVDRMEILSGDIKGTQDEIKELAEMDVESQKRIVDLILNEGELSIHLASSRLWDENKARRRKELEEKQQQMEQQLKAEREEEAAKEKEKLRIAHEERLKQEAAQLEAEKAAQEKRKLAEMERQKKEAEQQKIASALSKVDSQIQDNYNYLTKLQELKKGLMQDLLTGKVRVKN